MALLLGGLSLSQYAGVTAALAEGFELGEILAQEDIDPVKWPDASRAWTEAIVEAPDLQIELIQQRRVAEDCLGREMAPLDRDPAAWTGLLGALALTETPGALTEALGITMGDVARLGRQWKRKMVSDPELAKQIEELAPTAKPPARVEAGPRALKPFPWTPAPKSPAAREPSKDASVGHPIPLAPSAAAARPRRELASFQLEEKAPAPRAPEIREAPLGPPPPAAMPVVPGLPPAVSAQLTAWAPSSAPAQAAMPFESLDPGAHGVSLLRYAQLITLVQQPGVDVSVVLAGFGLDEAKHKAIEEHYNKKFAREARWATEFGRLVTQAQKTMRERRAAETNPAGTGTSSVPLPVPPAAPSPTSAPRSHAPELSMEQYAWVTATLRKTPPEKLDEVLRRLRLTPQTREELDSRWRARVATEPGLRAALGAAIQQQLHGAAPQTQAATPPPKPAPPLPAATPVAVVNVNRAAEPARTNAPNKLAGTVLASPDGPKGPATPFVNPAKREK